MTQHHEHHPEEHGLPAPTIWPLVMAAGIALAAAGIVMNVVVTASGVILIGLSLWGWIRALRTQGMAGAEPATAVEQPEEGEARDVAT